MNDAPRVLAKESDRLTGMIERVSFHSDDSGFTVLKVRVSGQRDLITVIGTVATIGAGEMVEAVGYWRVDATHGRQFQARQLVSVAPTTPEGVEKYLASGAVKGVGPHFAKILVSNFGADVFEIIENDPSRLTELRGIGPKRVEKIVSSWSEQRKVREIMVFLHSHGVGTSRAVRIYRTYGDFAIAKVTENPYHLARDIRGIGFRTADELGRRLGIAPNSMMRAQAGVSYVLSEFADKGNCATDYETAIEEAEKILEIPSEILRIAIQKEIAEESIVADEISSRRCLYLASLYFAEVGVANSVTRLEATRSLPWGEIDIERAISWVEKQNSILLSTSQRDALRLAISSKIIVITGGPGVGKTTLINSLIQILEKKRVKILLCAPTGRAAKRMSESTGRTAKTIHRTLEFDPAIGEFKHNKDNPLVCDLLVIDEASMVDVVLMNKLLSALPSHVALCIVGDVDQLPSVGPGAVLSDLIASERIPTVRLTEIFRQAATSMIIQNAHLINSGKMPRDNIEGARRDFFLVRSDDPEDIQKRLIRLVAKRIPERFGFDPITEVQVLTPMNRSGLGARALNVLLQEQLNPNQVDRVERFGVTYCAGDKVLQLVNNYKKEVFNGDIGIIATIDNVDLQVSVDFDANRVVYDFTELDELSLAYATSIHKSQGSEYRAVVIPMSTQHYTMLDRKLLYTAVTRAKDLVVLVGDSRAIAIAVKNLRAVSRLTGLRERLVNGITP